MAAILEAQAPMRAGTLLRERTRRTLLVWCFLVPSLAIFLIYRIIPLAWNVILSFEYWTPLRPAEFAGLDHYQDLLDDEVFWQALWNTVMVIASAPIGIAIALALALLVNSDIRGRDVYRTIIFLSYPLMTVAVAIIWRWMFDERGRPHQLHGAPPQPHRQADPFPQLLHLRPAVRDRGQYLADARLLHDHPPDRAAEHPP